MSAELSNSEYAKNVRDLTRLNSGVYEGAVPGLSESDRKAINDHNLDLDSSFSDEIITANSMPGDLESFTGEINSTSKSANEVEVTEGKDATQPPQAPSALQRTKTRYLSPKIKDQRKAVVVRWLWTMLLLACFCFTVLVLFWGVLYKTPKYVKKVKVLAVIQEDPIYRVNDTFEVPSVSTPLKPILKGVGFHWTFLNATEFEEKYNVSGPEEVQKRLVDLIYDEKYWAIVNVKRNATQQLVESLMDPLSNTTFNSTSQFQFLYETGRDISNMPIVIEPALRGIQEYFSKVYSTMYLPALLQNISTPQNFNPIKIADAGIMNFEFYDHRPVTDRQYLIISQIGNVYCVVLTLFVFLMMGPVHTEIAKLVHARQMWIYRLIILWSTLFFGSLFYCAVSAIFKVDFTKAFG